MKVFFDVEGIEPLETKATTVEFINFSEGWIKLGTTEKSGLHYLRAIKVLRIEL